VTGVALVVMRRRPGLLDLDEVARQAGLHPEMVLRLVRLGVVDLAGGTLRAPLFARNAPAHLARAVRLRHDLGLDYAGALLVGELVDRIARLEARAGQDGRSNR
jgi:chaperone modulatory protein CbpM